MKYKTVIDSRRYFPSFLAHKLFVKVEFLEFFDKKEVNSQKYQLHNSQITYSLHFCKDALF